MLIAWISAILLLQSLPLRNAEILDDECDASAMQDCELFDPGSLPSSYDATAFQQYCSAAEEHGRCIKAINCTGKDVLPENYLVQLGISDADKYLCSNHTLAVIGEGSLWSCIHMYREYRDEIFRNCTMEMIPTNVTGLPDATICRHYNDFYKCIYETIRAQCNASAAVVVTKYNEAVMTPTLARINCSVTYPSSPLMCPACPGGCDFGFEKAANGCDICDICIQPCKGVACGTGEYCHQIPVVDCSTGSCTTTWRPECKETEI